MTVQRHRGLTEQAAQAAVDQACRMLRLPTIRGQFPELAEAAAREQLSYLGPQHDHRQPGHRLQRRLRRLAQDLHRWLTFGGNIIETGTDSYRLAQTRARAEHNAGRPRWPQPPPIDRALVRITPNDESFLSGRSLRSRQVGRGIQGRRLRAECLVHHALRMPS